MSIDPRYYGLIEMGMTFGVVAVFTVHQLWSLRDRPGDSEPEARDSDDPADRP